MEKQYNFWLDHILLLEFLSRTVNILLLETVFDLPRGLLTGLNNMDSVSEPPSSTVSYLSYGGDSFTASTGPTSASSSSRRSSMYFPFFSPYTVFRGNNNNAVWYHSSGGARHIVRSSFTLRCCQRELVHLRLMGVDIHTGTCDMSSL